MISVPLTVEAQPSAPRKLCSGECSVCTECVLFFDAYLMAALLRVTEKPTLGRQWREVKSRQKLGLILGRKRIGLCLQVVFSKTAHP